MLNTSFRQNANKDKAVLYLRYSSIKVNLRDRENPQFGREEAEERESHHAWHAGTLLGEREVRRRPPMRRDEKRERHPSFGGQSTLGEMPGTEKEEIPQQIPQETH